MQYAIFSSVLLMGFLGSMHCGVMCGPLSCNLKNKNQFLSYHLGRLVSYISIAALLFLGSQYLLNTESRKLKLVISILFTLFFVIFGLIQLNFIRWPEGRFNFYKIQFFLLQKSKNLIDKFPVVLGLLTGLFPCSWLYSFFFFSTQLPKLTDAVIAIMLFWLSSLPAFLVVTSLLRELIRKSPYTYQKISGVILIIAGIFSVMSHWADIMLL